jgi:hypothetical protein
MKNGKSFHFRGQMQNEEVIEFIRRHWMVLLPAVIPFILYMTALIVFVAYSSQFTLPSLEEPFFQFLVILATIGTTLMVHRFFLKLIEHFMKIVIISSFRVVEINKTLFLHDDKQSTVLKRMQDIQKQQKGIVKSILGVGDIVIIISFADPKVIDNIPNPNYYFRLLNQLRSHIFERQHKQVEPAGKKDDGDLQEFGPGIVEDTYDISI